MKNAIKKICEVKLCLMLIINTNNDQEGLKKFYLRKYQKKVF